MQDSILIRRIIIIFYYNCMETRNKLKRTIEESKKALVNQRDKFKVMKEIQLNAMINYNKTKKIQLIVITKKRAFNITKNRSKSKNKIYNIV